MRIEADSCNPCEKMNFKQNNGFMMRVRAYGNRIAAEFFHVLTDGAGGLCFFKTLLAEYITLRYKETVPRGDRILDCGQPPTESEQEDGFLRFSRGVTRSRAEPPAYFIPGTEEDGFTHVTTGRMDADRVAALAKQMGGTVTELLAGVLILAIQDIQQRIHPHLFTHRPVKLCVPVNLRRFYQTDTLRNFSSYINPGIEPRFGSYTLAETVRQVRGTMMAELDEKKLNAKFSTNVKSESNRAVRLIPLFLKKPVMKAAFYFSGDKQTSSTLSNLGQVTLPPEMERHISRMDFMLGSLMRNRVTAASLTYGGVLTLNFTRKITEPHVERNFFRHLVELGIPVTIESNTPYEHAPGGERR